VVLYIMYYTAHHLGQVFVPYVIAGGTGMMLSCYLFHVETNLEQVWSVCAGLVSACAAPHTPHSVA
jgi:hypothetical protein